ncbi:MAG: S-layer homology domain-containing protein [Clostridia bacterium]|nr:S-layer homology domain-containing protein [Clostridia bacterium]
MKKILSLVLCALMAVSTLAFTVSASQGEAPRVDGDTIVYDYRTLFCEFVNKATVGIADRDATFDGRSVVKITPTPDLANSTVMTLDHYGVDGKAVKIPLPDYKYVGVTYYYQSENPSYNGKLYCRFSNPMSCEVLSNKDIVANKWDEAIFNLSAMSGTPGNLKQMGIRPFNNTNPGTLKETDVIYIDKVVFYKKNPDPDSLTTISLRKVNPDAQGEDKDYKLKPGETFTLPENPYNFENAEFLGWKKSGTEDIVPAGTVVSNPEFDIVYEAQWKVRVVSPDIATFSFSDYANGIVTNRDTGVVENGVEFDGKVVVQVTPNPAYTEERSVIIDGYNYTKANIDLSAYKYAAIEYYYESQQPVTGKQKIEIRNLGNTLSKPMSFQSREDIITDAWAVSTFDISELSTAFIEGTVPFLRQMWVYGFGTAIGHDQHPDDTLYISSLIFFKDEPEFDKHETYMNGYADGTFLPAGTMTRAEACTVIARLLEKEENIAGTSAFADVPADQWFAKYIGFCEAKGLLKSYSGSFEPNKPITRAEFSELVYLTGLAQDKGIKAAFTDVPADHAKYTSIMAAASAGLINGYAESDGTFTFKPDNTITRAEVVTVINRAKGISKKMENLTGNIYILFLDVDSTHWAFADIAEATVPHVEQAGQWLYTTKDPLLALSEKIDTTTLYNKEAGYAKVAEYDALEEKRIEEIRSTPNMDLSGIKGKKIYVSSSTGDDKNDGLSESTPVKTVLKAMRMTTAGDAVLFKRGDIWREKWQAVAGVVYTAYGEGAKPTFYGSPENGADPKKWTLVHEDKETGALIWKYYDEKNYDDVGTIVFNDGVDGGFAIKERPTYDGKWLVRGKNDVAYDWKKELDKNFEFVHLAESASKIINIGTARGPLYFRCDNGNPGKVFDSLEFNTRINVIQAANNVTFDNICVKYGGSHGIGSGTVVGLVIQNCEIGWIGGSTQGYNANGSVTPFGNGIEVYGACDGYVIENCYVYQCYDAGITHQISKGSTVDAREDNILYKDNVITDCVYNIEYFLSASTDKPTALRQGKNVVIEGNLLRRAGYGFGSIRPDVNNQRNIRSGNSKNEFTEYYIRNNVLDRAVHELTQTYSDFDATAPVYDGNVYIQGIGNHLFENGRGHKAEADLGAKYAIQTALGDKNAQVYYVDYIPKYTYTYTHEKKAEVTDEDRKVAAAPAVPEKELLPAVAESTNVTDPLLIRTQKDKTLYKDKRNSYDTETLVDSATGITYVHLSFKDDSAAINMDCHGLPKPKTGNGVVYFKILMRTNQQVAPYINVYRFKDADGNVLLASKAASATNPAKGTDEWEEVIVQITGVPAGTAYFDQIHLMPMGNVKGSSYFEGGKLKDNAYVDVAAWAVFENLVSAQAFDLKAVAK